jgi:hypothetical protein
MSLAYDQRTNLSLEKLEVPYLIPTHGGRVVADCMACKIPLRVDRANLSYQPSHLGRSGHWHHFGTRWMKMHKTLLDISTCLVHLDSPMTGKVTLHLRAMARFQAFVHTTVAKSLEEIPIVWEYPDVFLDELLGMSPARVVHFKIVLQPSTIPISKRPDRMPPNELAELKIQLQ